MKTVDDQLTKRLADVEATFEETLVQLTDRDLASDQNLYREVTTRHAELKPVVEAFRSHKAISIEIADARELASHRV